MEKNENLDKLFTNADVVGDESILADIGVLGFEDENEQRFVGGVLWHTHRRVRHRRNGEFRFVLINALHRYRYRCAVELTSCSV